MVLVTIAMHNSWHTAGGTAQRAITARTKRLLKMVRPETKRMFENSNNRSFWRGMVDDFNVGMKRIWRWVSIP